MIRMSRVTFPVASSKHTYDHDEEHYTYSFEARCKFEKGECRQKVWPNKKEKGRMGRRRNRAGSHFDEIDWKGGSSAASWMLGIPITSPVRRDS